MALDILVVDDEQDIRELVAGVLTDEGYECRTAGDSTRALQLVDDADWRGYELAGAAGRPVRRAR